MAIKLVHQSGPVPQRDNLLRMPRVEAKTSLKKTYIYELMRKPLEEGGFPRPVRLGGRAVAWSENEVQAWVDARIAEARK